MIKPPYLQEGDRIGLVSPAGKITSTQVKASVKVLQRWGLEPVFGRHIFSSQNLFAGSDEDRTIDIQEFFDDESIKAIISTRGGYGSVRVIDKLDFSQFQKKPKWFIGYSDITVFHSHIQQNFKIETIHATMPINSPEDFSENDSIISLRQALFGELSEYVCSECKILKKGNTHGILIGGNLSVLYSLIGSKSDIDTNGKILFIEDLDEYTYHIDRMMINLKRSGKLAKLKGLIIGGMSNMNEGSTAFGKTPNEIICEHVKEYDFPVVSSFPTGHQEKNMALYLGREIEINAGDNEFHLRFL